MIKELICWLWGHKTVHKGYTGETMRQSNGFGMAVDVALYTFTRTKFCTRCGKEVHPSNPKLTLDAPSDSVRSEERQ